MPFFKFYDEMKDLGDKWLFICSRSGHKMCHDKIERSFEGTDDVRYYEILEESPVQVKLRR